MISHSAVILTSWPATCSRRADTSWQAGSGQPLILGCHVAAPQTPPRIWPAAVPSCRQPTKAEEKNCRLKIRRKKKEKKRRFFNYFQLIASPEVFPHMALLYQGRHYHIVVGSRFNPSWSHEETYCSIVFCQLYRFWFFFSMHCKTTAWPSVIRRQLPLLKHSLPHRWLIAYLSEPHPVFPHLFTEWMFPFYNSLVLFCSFLFLKTYQKVNTMIYLSKNCLTFTWNYTEIHYSFKYLNWLKQWKMHSAASNILTNKVKILYKGRMASGFSRIIREIKLLSFWVFSFLSFGVNHYHQCHSLIAYISIL